MNDQPRDVRVLARIIDVLTPWIAARWTAQGVFPSVPAGIEFLRQFDPRYSSQPVRVRDFRRLLRRRKASP